MPGGVLEIAILDIGGEARHPGAWNLNPSPLCTMGPNRGEPIPRLVLGRADAIPLADSSVGEIVVERTPLREGAFDEIRRVAKPGARIILRHVIPPGGDPHRVARRLLGEPIREGLITLGPRTFRESVFVCRK